MKDEQLTGVLPGKYLTFALAGEEYGLPVLKAREIIKLMDITAVPRVPPHVKGVINLRGKVVPVIDLRLKFGLAVEQSTDRTCIIVVEAVASGRSVMLGIIVDQVSDVVNITAEEIEPPPDFGEQLDTRYMLGIAKIKGKVKMLLDLDKSLTVEVAFAEAA
jgi:purine-binding chemotaxis protein CheW